MDNETHDIHHEHLAGISQHDWYVKCVETNEAVYLEDTTYRVVALESETNNEISFVSLQDLMAWAGY